MTYSEPIACDLTKGQIAGFAQAVVEKMGLTPGYPVEDVVARLGGKVLFQDLWTLGSTSDGSIRIEAENNFEIYLPMHTGRERDRFTIAHELGHYFLHYLYARQDGQGPSKMKARRAGTGKLEWQANWFAAALLMPENQFRAAFEDMGRDIYLVASKFGVSLAAAKIRAETLGLA